MYADAPNPIEARNDAIATARRIVASNPVYLDTETTGLNDDDEIVEIAVLQHVMGARLLNTYVKPGRPIPANATAVNHITDEMVANAPRFDVVWQAQLAGMLVGRALPAKSAVCVYNAAYDRRLIKQTLKQYGIEPHGMKPFFCVMELYAQFSGDWNDYHGNWRWCSLANALIYSQLHVDNLHSAAADAEGARLILNFIASQELTHVAD